MTAVSESARAAGAPEQPPRAWSEPAYRLLREAGYRQFPYVPDSGHRELIPFDQTEDAGIPDNLGNAAGDGLQHDIVIEAGGSQSGADIRQR